MRHYIGSMRYLLLFHILVAATPAVFAAGEPFGYRLYLQGEQQEQAAPVEASPAEEQQLAAQIQRLEVRLAEQRYETGPFGASMAETLDELARAQDAAGLDLQALKSWEQALYLTRLNEGLYAPSQAPIVRAMLEKIREIGDFESLDERYEYFSRLYRITEPPWTDRRWRAAREYMRWQREALLLRLDGQPLKRLLKLHTLNETTIESLVGNPDWTKHRDAALDYVATLYLVELLVAPQPQFERRRDGFQDTPDDPFFDPQMERMQSLLRRARTRGRDVLEAALTAIPPDELQARAELQLAIADWILWQGSTASAADRYLSIWALLNDAGLTELANKWFGEPVPLPANGVFVIEPREIKTSGYASFDVSTSGRVRVRADAATPARIRRHLTVTRFRPVIRGGQFVPTSLESVPLVVFEIP